MTEENTNFIGNFSTILTWIYFLLGPILIKYGITQDVFMSLAYAIIGLIIAIWSSKNPNTLKWLGNNIPKEKQLILKEIILNEEYENPNNEEDTNDEGC